MPSFSTALAAGALAGTTVDLSLFPLDTLKTRLQAREGFFASGGFRGIYRGVGSAVVGSAPGAALFFCTYETTKNLLRHHRDGKERVVDHMIAASLGEIAACAVRVPTEVVKQRAQAGQHGGSSAGALGAILSLYREKQPSSSFRVVGGVVRVWRQLYRGWGITVLREVPFTVIQFPLWEGMKAWGRQRHASNSVDSKSEVGAVESAVYGSIAGGIAAALTTPLDVLKTRVMLAPPGRTSVVGVLRGILRDEGPRPLLAGIGPRTMWISIGGAVFLGSYTWVVNLLGDV